MTTTENQTETQSPAIPFEDVGSTTAKAKSAPIKITVETITPEKAEELLQGNKSNRPVNQAHVKRLAKDMSEGRWVFNGDEIRLTAGKVILDGQHRLLACVMAGVPFNTVVVSGLPMSVFPTIDTGLPRTGAHTLAVMGETNASRLASALRYVHRYLSPEAAARRGKLTNSEVQDLLKAHPFVRDSLALALANESKLLPVSQLAAIHYLFSLRSKEEADAFVAKLKDGVGLEEGNPVLVLRERLVLNAASKAKVGEDYVAALVIKAWNAYRKGENIKALRFREKGKSPEGFPGIE